MSYSVLPTEPLCMLCSEPVYGDITQFPCRCYFYIHRRCVTTFQDHNYTCVSCGQIVINIFPSLNMGRSHHHPYYIYPRYFWQCATYFAVLALLLVVIALILLTVKNWNAAGTHSWMYNGEYGRNCCDGGQDTDFNQYAYRRHDKLRLWGEWSQSSAIATNRTQWKTFLVYVSGRVCIRVLRLGM